MMLKMKVECIWKKDKKVEKCIAIVEQINDNRNFCEVLIASSTAIRLIVGYRKWGNFICIPERRIGTNLSNFKDFFGIRKYYAFLWER
jgi:hypothetical protein